MNCLSQIEGLVSAVEAAENCPNDCYSYILVDAKKMRVMCLIFPAGTNTDDDINLRKDFQPHILPVCLFYEPGRNTLQGAINAIIFCCWCGLYKGYSNLCDKSRRPYAEKVFNAWKHFSTLPEFSAG